ncbi:saccharopine dehydrogenase NADP-binding domain-containing protein [Celeribacter sp. ULVN23_4]
MDRILIVGGTGHVGQKIAQRLMQEGDVSLTLGGRSPKSGRAAARRLGCQWTHLDIGAHESWNALDSADTVIVCIDLPDPGFTEAVLSRGLKYIDITATDSVLRRSEALDGLARENDALAVLSVGLAPGLSNLMALAATQDMDEISDVTIGICLGMGDSHGVAAIDWTLDMLRPVQRGDIAPLRFSPTRPPLLTIPFDFADQHVMRRQGYANVTTRLGLDGPFMSRTMFRFLGALARSHTGRNALRLMLTSFRIGSDVAMLTAISHGSSKGQNIQRHLTLEGRGEAQLTAAVAAEVAKRLSKATETGVHHIHNLWSLEAFSDVLTQERIVFSRH